MTVQSTSLEAFESVKDTLNKKQTEVFEFMRGKNPMTDKEISDGMNRPINCITNRRGELVKRKLVRYAGCKIGVTGRRAMVWSPIIVDKLF